MPVFLPCRHNDVRRLSAPSDSTCSLLSHINCLSVHSLCHTQSTTDTQTLSFAHNQQLLQLLLLLHSSFTHKQQLLQLLPLLLHSHTTNNYYNYYYYSCWFLFKSPIIPEITSGWARSSKVYQRRTFTDC